MDNFSASASDFSLDINPKVLSMNTLLPNSKKKTNLRRKKNDESRFSKNYFGKHRNHSQRCCRCC
ncbi:hypothetical protein CLOAM1728 [Candidatus Cloacimonas acidaminovorans str. Evry]|uniref:Uncharacterized protein n=1 Tax=Cloacimonas acidaminovorans (strain Evry) TaxID=459349 RepID=B0VJB0_CLOAI|nr:hypothetical protein CLOAM1728 [Candidatus Cloacimonas acidaminovorans str. Evry]